MQNLTVNEKRVFDNMSRKMDPSVRLGEKLQEIITDDGKDMALGTPTNATKASVVLDVTGFYGHLIAADAPVCCGVILIAAYAERRRPSALWRFHSVPHCAKHSSPTGLAAHRAFLAATHVAAQVG